VTYNQPPSYSPPPALNPSDERLWATLTHVSALIGIVVGAGFLGWLGPLIIFLVLKDRSAFVADHAKTTLNFQITMAIVIVASWAIAIVTLFLLFFVPIIVGLVVGVLVIVFSIIAAVAAYRGERYQYPLTIRFLR
jgi:uncharacterized Tic20 family protein